MSVLVLATPVAVLMVLWVSGLGLADVLARRLPPDSRAALAPLSAVVVLVLSSPLALAGVRPLALGAAVLGLLVLLTAMRLRRMVPVLRQLADRSSWPSPS